MPLLEASDVILGRLGIGRLAGVPTDAARLVEVSRGERAPAAYLGTQAGGSAA